MVSVPDPFPQILFPNEVDCVANEIRSREWKVICFSKHCNRARRGYNGPVIKPDYRRGDCMPRMWDQYGEKHKGVCLVFDGKKLHEIMKKVLGASSRIFHGHVRYQDETGPEAKRSRDAIFFQTIDIEKYGLDEAVQRHFLQHYQEIFLRKVTDWQSEREYRFLVYDKTRRPSYVPIKGGIERVIVGHDFPKSCETKLAKLCTKLDIPAGRIKWKNRLPYVYPDAIYKV